MTDDTRYNPADPWPGDPNHPSQIRIREERQPAIDDALALVNAEIEDAYKKFPRSSASAHEAFAILLEEADELKAEVWKGPKTRDYEKMQKEAVQVAAMAVRLILDVIPKSRPVSNQEMHLLATGATFRCILCNQPGATKHRGDGTWVHSGPCHLAQKQAPKEHQDICFKCGRPGANGITRGGKMHQGGCCHYDSQGRDRGFAWRYHAQGDCMHRADPEAEPRSCVDCGAVLLTEVPKPAPSNQYNCARCNMPYRSTTERCPKCGHEPARVIYVDDAKLIPRAAGPRPRPMRCLDCNTVFSTGEHCPADVRHLSFVQTTAEHAFRPGDQVKIVGPLPKGFEHLGLVGAPAAVQSLQAIPVEKQQNYIVDEPWYHLKCGSRTGSLPETCLEKA